MPQVVAAVFTWVGNVASAVFGGGGAVGAGTGATTAGGISGGMAAVGTGITAGTTAVTSVAANAGLWAAVGNAALNMAISGVLSVAFKPSLASSSGAPLDFKADPGAAVPFCVGRTATGGSSIYAEVFGGSNAKFLRFVIVFSGGGPIEAVESFTSNERAETFGGTSGRNAVGYYHDFMYMDYKLGAQPETVHDVLIPPWGSTPSATWTTAHKLSGLATAQWILRYNNRIYSTGVPTPLWVIKGPAVYDPRNDSTYPGGSGPQRYDDPDTWSFVGNDNPYLQALTWCLGHQSNGKVALGAGIPWEGIDVAAFVEGANIAEDNDWTCGGMVYSSESKWAILEAMLRAGGGRPMRLGAKVSCVVNTPRVSIATLTSADIEGDLVIKGTPGRRDRFNTARPRFRDEASNWQFVQADPVVIAAALTEDGEPRSREIDFGLVQDLDQASQLAAYDILNSRELGPVTFSAIPKWMGLKPGDCVTLDDYFGTFKLVIQDRERDVMTGSRNFSCMAESDDKHTTALAVTGSLPDPPDYEEIDDTEIDPPDLSQWGILGLAVTP